MSSRKWNVVVIVLFLVFSILLLQFLFATLHIRELVNPNGVKTNSPLAHVVLIAQETNNPYWRTIEQGAREASREFGMDLEYTGPLRLNPDEQIRLLSKAIASKPDAILVQGINDPRHRILIDKAADQGIPVITLDADEPDSRRLSYIGTDNYNAGVKMGEYVVKTTGTEGSMGVLVSNRQSYSQQLRLAGFHSVISGYPNLAVVDVRSSENSRLQAAQQTREILDQYPQVSRMVGFSALDGLGILEASGRYRTRELKIFAFDDLSDTRKAIQEDRLELSIVQKPHEIGYRAISMLRDYLQGKKPADTAYTETDVLLAPSISGVPGGGTP